MARGVTGTSRNVSRFVTDLRQQERQQERSGLDARDQRGLRVREAVGLLLRHHDAITTTSQRSSKTAEQQTTRTRVCQAHTEIGQAAALLSGFRQRFHEHDPQALATWLEAAEQSGVPAVRALVTKLRQDLPAVEAAVTLPWSQGQAGGRPGEPADAAQAQHVRARQVRSPQAARPLPQRCSVTSTTPSSV